MTFQEALSHYKSNRALAKALNVSNGRVSQLKSDGGFAYPLQCVLEKDSGGVLVARHVDDPRSGVVGDSLSRPQIANDASKPTASGQN